MPADLIGPRLESGAFYSTADADTRAPRELPLLGDLLDVLQRTATAARATVDRVGGTIGDLIPEWVIQERLPTPEGTGSAGAGRAPAAGARVDSEGWIPWILERMGGSGSRAKPTPEREPGFLEGILAGGPARIQTDVEVSPSAGAFALVALAGAAALIVALVRR